MDEVSVTTSSTSRTTTTIFDSTTPEVTATTERTTTEAETTKNQETSTTEKEATTNQEITTTEIIATSTTYSPSLVCPFCPEPNGNFEIPGNCTSFYNCTNGVATVEVILFF
jgi:hypothetical protein